jgi:hypothetical protein
MIELRKDMEDEVRGKAEPDPDRVIAPEGTGEFLPEHGSDVTAAFEETEEYGIPEEQTDQGVFLFDGREFRTPSELALYFQNYADRSRRELAKKVRELYVDKEHLVPEFEAWLIAIGKEKELNAWKKKFGGESR